MSENKFYLSVFVCEEHAMGNMLIVLSDTNFTRETDHRVKHLLKQEDVVLCECEPRKNGVYTIGMAKVTSFKKNGVTPEKIEHVWGRQINLEEVENIIDHRKGHTRECKCGA